MASDSFDDDELGPVSREERADAERRRRRDLTADLPSRQRGRARHGGGKDGSGPLGEMAGATLPGGTADQITLLLNGRRQRLRNLWIRIGLIVILPTIIVWFYAALIATPRYVCNFEITYQAYAPNSNLSASLVQSAVGASQLDAVDYGTLLYEYIRSADLANKVDQQINLREHYSSDRIDGLSRLGKNASQQAYLAYWRAHVSVAEGFGGYVTVQVEGFEPAYTLLLAQTITTDADNMINSLGAAALRAQVKSATVQLYVAGVLLKNANTALTVFRNTHGDLDPSFAATQLATIVGTLESNLALLNAQLQQAEANMQPNAPQIVQLKLQAGALQQQIQSERARLADKAGATYSNTVAQYNDLLANQQFAATTYQSAQQGLIVAQANVASQQNFAVDFVAPILPDQPTLPDPLISSLTILLVFGSLYAIGNLLFAAFRDQSGL